MEKLHKYQGELIHQFINGWRGRRVMIYSHTHDESFVITVGYPSDGSKEIVCEEAKKNYQHIIDGKITRVS